jgi:hypothetical protein
MDGKLARIKDSPASMHTYRNEAQYCVTNKIVIRFVSNTSVNMIAPKTKGDNSLLIQQLSPQPQVTTVIK